LFQRRRQDETRLEHLRHQYDRLLKCFQGVLRLAGSVEGEADKIVKFGRTRLQLESGLKSLEGAVILLAVPEPVPELGVSVGVGMGPKLSFEFFGTSAGMRARSYGGKGHEEYYCLRKHRMH
jgi:hypothetical protein